MRENKFNKGYSDYDYITKTISFDYVYPTQEQTQFVKNIIFKICNCNPSHMDYYLGVMGQALTGDAELEKALYFCVGVGGNNGKTLILEALTDIMPNYVSKIERQTFEKGYTKAHKHLTGTKGKRIVYVEELSTKEQNIETLKEIADGKTIKNEVLFGTDELINIMFKLIFLSNCQANMKVDGGIGNRYRQLCHNSKFNKETTEDNYETLDFVQDRTLASLLKGEYKYALIQLLLDSGHEYTKTNKLIIPTEFQEAIENTLETNDEVKMWFNENCEYGEDFKCSKKELEENISKPFREIQVEIQRITNFKYVRDMRCGKLRGGFKGFRIKTECLIVE
jgi:phage/plasmid-associated DNA primase